MIETENPREGCGGGLAIGEKIQISLKNPLTNTKNPSAKKPQEKLEGFVSSNHCL